MLANELTPALGKRANNLATARIALSISDGEGLVSMSRGMNLNSMRNEQLQTAVSRCPPLCSRVCVVSERVQVVDVRASIDLEPNSSGDNNLGHHCRLLPYVGTDGAMKKQ